MCREMGVFEAATNEQIMHEKTGLLCWWLNKIRLQAWSRVQINKRNQRHSKSSTRLEFRELQKPWQSQRMGFSSFFSHCPVMAKAISGLLGVSGYFPKKFWCYLSDQVTYNPFSNVSVELKNINLIIKETPLLHFPGLAPPFWCNREWHRNLIAPSSLYIAATRTL